MAETVHVGVLEAILRLQDTMSPALVSAGRRMQRWGNQMSRVGGDLTRTLSLPIAAVGGASLKAAIDFESAFAGIRKTVDASEEEFARLSDEIRTLSTELPISATELARVGEAAGQLGVGVEHIAKFTETMAGMGIATDLSADEAAMALARFSNVMGTSLDDVDRLASTIVGLGNNFAATESEIVEFGLRLSGAGAQVGMTEGEVLGLSAALASVGINAESGGSALSRVMVDIASAVAEGGDELQKFAAVAALSGEVAAQDFATAWREDAGGALAAFIAGLGQVEDAGGSTFAVLEVLGEDTLRVRDALLRTSAASEDLSRALAQGNDEWAANSAAQLEVAKRVETTAAQLTLLKNNLTNVAIELGGALLPVFQRAVGMMREFTPVLMSLVQGFAALPQPAQTAILATAGLVAALGPLLMLVGQASVGIGALIRFIPRLTRGFANKAKILTKLKPLFMWLVSGVQGLGAGVGALFPRVAMLGRVLIGLSGPVGWLVTALSTLLLTTENGRRIFGNFARLIGSLVIGTFRRLGEWIGKIGDAFSFLGGKLRGFFGPILETLNGALGGVADWTDTWASSTEHATETVEQAAVETATLAGTLERDLIPATETLETATYDASAAQAHFAATFAETTEAAFQLRTEFVALERQADIKLPFIQQLHGSIDTISLLGNTIRRDIFDSSGNMILTQPVRDLNEALGRSPSLFDRLRGSVQSFMEGLTGGEGLAGFMTNLGAGFVEGLGTILSGGVSSLIAMGTQLAMKGLSALGNKVWSGMKKIGGAIKGIFTGRSTERNIELTGQRMGLLISDGLQSTIAATADRVGHDMTAMLLHLNDIVAENGGVMVAGFQKVARTGRNLFSMVQRGHIDLDEAMTALGPVLQDLAANFDNAGERGKLQFTELIHVARAMGVDLEDLRALVGDLADQALGTDLDRALIDINGDLTALGQTLDGLPERVSIQADFDVDAGAIDDMLRRLEDARGPGIMPIPQFARGSGGVRDFGSGTLAMLHGREAVIPEGDLRGGNAALLSELRGLRRELHADRSFDRVLAPKMLSAMLAQAGATR